MKTSCTSPTMETPRIRIRVVCTGRDDGYLGAHDRIQQRGLASIRHRAPPASCCCPFTIFSERRPASRQRQPVRRPEGSRREDRVLGRDFRLYREFWCVRGPLAIDHCIPRQRQSLPCTHSCNSVLETRVRPRQEAGSVAPHQHRSRIQPAIAIDCSDYRLAAVCRTGFSFVPFAASWVIRMNLARPRFRATSAKSDR